MKESLSARKRRRRLAHLKAVRNQFGELQGHEFKLVTFSLGEPYVHWEGTVSSPELQRRYHVRIEFGPNYPYSRPKVFPLDSGITSNRHQNPRQADREVGEICLFQDSLSDWAVGTPVSELVGRVTNWFFHMEQGTLDEQAAPPEIERYYPPEQRANSSTIFAHASLMETGDREYGSLNLYFSADQRFSFLLLDSVADVEAERVAILDGVRKKVFPTQKLDLEEPIAGYWYLVEQEPYPPPLTTADLIRFVASHSPNDRLNERVICDGLPYDQPVVIALRYPTIDDSNRWILYMIELTIPRVQGRIVPGFRNSSLYKLLLWANRSSKVKIRPVNHLDPRVLFGRVDHPTFEVLKAVSVAVVGCGALGSHVARLLTESGLSHLTLIDPEKLEVGNVSRHVLGLDDVGMNKAVAMRRYLLRKNPFSCIEAVEKSILDPSLPINSILTRTDLVISCVGNDPIEEWVSDASVGLDRPVLISRSYARATLGEILLATAGGACLRCARAFVDQNREIIPEIPRLGFEDTVGFDTDCGTAFIPGSSVDLSHYAIHTVRLAIQYLEGNATSPNYWLVRGRPFEAERFPEVDSRLDEPFTIHSFTAKGQKDCDVCSI